MWVSFHPPYRVRSASTKDALVAPSVLTNHSFSQGWSLIDLLLRASNEGLLRPRVARAREIIRLHPLLSRRIWRHEHEDFEALCCVILYAMFFPGRRHRPLPRAQYLFL